jgi:hypothetical protein
MDLISHERAEKAQSRRKQQRFWDTSIKKGKISADVPKTHTKDWHPLRKNNLEKAIKP